MKESKILTFYNIKQVCFDGIEKDSYSKSPLKPYLLLKKIKKDGYGKMLEINGNFEPFQRSDFYLAHKKRYVDNVFDKNYALSYGYPEEGRKLWANLKLKY